MSEWVYWVCSSMSLYTRSYVLRAVGVVYTHPGTGHSLGGGGITISNLCYFTSHEDINEMPCKSLIGYDPFNKMS